MKFKTMLLVLLVLTMAVCTAQAGDNDPYSGTLKRSFTDTTVIAFPYKVGKVQAKVISGDPVEFTLAVANADSTVGGALKYPDSESLRPVFYLSSGEYLTLGRLGNVTYLRAASEGTSTLLILYAKER